MRRTLLRTVRRFESSPGSRLPQSPESLRPRRDLRGPVRVDVGQRNPLIAAPATPAVAPAAPEPFSRRSARAAERAKESGLPVRERLVATLSSAAATAAAARPSRKAARAVGRSVSVRRNRLIPFREPAAGAPTLSSSSLWPRSSEPPRCPPTPRPAKARPSARRAPRRRSPAATRLRSSSPATPSASRRPRRR